MERWATSLKNILDSQNLINYSDKIMINDLLSMEYTEFFKPVKDDELKKILSKMPNDDEQGGRLTKRKRGKRKKYIKAKKTIKILKSKKINKSRRKRR